MRPSRAAHFRELLDKPAILLMPGVYDGFSARLVEQVGFEAAVITGSGLSESRLGRPDVGLMGLETNVAAARSLVECTSIPLIADADTGYGNAINVYFTVQAFEAAGVAGVTIEDQVSPKRCGHLAGKEVISAEEMVEKVHAAVDARTDPNFVIKARTDAAGVLGVDEAVRRLNLYADAGADHLFADALLSFDDIRTVAASVSKPLSVNMGFGIRRRPTTPLISAMELQELGVSAVSYPRLLSSTAIRGMTNGLQALLTTHEKGVVEDRPELAVTFEELSELMGIEEFRSMEDRYKTKFHVTSE